MPITTYTPILIDKTGNLHYISDVSAAKETAAIFAKNWAKIRIRKIKEYPHRFVKTAIIPALINNRTHRIIKL